NTTITSLKTLRSEYTGSSVILPEGTSVTGIVISDIAGGNLTSKAIIIQDSTGGMMLYCSAAPGFSLGDQVVVDVSGLSLTASSGAGSALEISTVPVSNITKTGTGTITPRTATISNIISNASAWESTLVRITGVTISGSGSTYSGPKTITDATNHMSFF